MVEYLTGKKIKIITISFFKKVKMTAPSIANQMANWMTNLVKMMTEIPYQPRRRRKLRKSHPRKSLLWRCWTQLPAIKKQLVLTGVRLSQS